MKQGKGQWKKGSESTTYLFPVFDVLGSTQCDPLHHVKQNCKKGSEF